MTTRWRHFKLEEFDCPCCGANKMSFDFIDKLEVARRLADCPLVVTSGYRCKKHNEEVNGSSRSAHLRGLAADIKCASAQMRYQVVDALLWVGFERLIIYPEHVHVDADITKPFPLIMCKTYEGRKS